MLQILKTQNISRPRQYVRRTPTRLFAYRFLHRIPSNRQLRPRASPCWTNPRHVPPDDGFLAPIRQAQRCTLSWFWAFEAAPRTLLINLRGCDSINTIHVVRPELKFVNRHIQWVGFCKNQAGTRCAAGKPDFSAN